MTNANPRKIATAPFLTRKKSFTSRTITGVFCGICICFFISAHVDAQEKQIEFGFSKQDITPTEPVRLSGYGNRNAPFEAIDEKLFVRAMAIRSGEEAANLHLLLSVETIGFPNQLTDEIFEQVRKKHSLSRSQFVICCTHDHTAPHIAGGLSNLFNQPLNEDEQAKTVAYTQRVKQLCLAAVDEAIADLQPGRLSLTSGKATFARNRRMLKDGLWSGFGENPDGPVDHSLPVIQIKSGGKIRGVLFNYACHCTTFGGEYNNVNGDWAGYAAKYLEESNPDAIAMCTIGCGADANPQRDPARALDLAQLQGREISDEVSRLIKLPNESNNPIPDQMQLPLESSFGFAGLPIDRPSVEELKEAMESPQRQVRHHAQVMLDTLQRMGRLPETYPMPIQVWKFGSRFNDGSGAFAMVFLGGEVCVEYATRIKRELAQSLEIAEDRIWVSAYSNDVFGYVVPERMRDEGGYEVDFSMIYYLQPGRWSSGTEDVIMKRVLELSANQGSNSEPLSVDQALQSFQTTDELEMRVLASEPVVQDPINFCVDGKGQLWVVEMGDYPRGDPASIEVGSVVHGSSDDASVKQPWEGQPGGKIKLLKDTDQDGIYDQATVFLDGLTFPNGVFPWRDGLLVSAAPDIFFARDLDGDGKCDERTVLYTGFSESNPQHRVNGFEWGLDGWLYVAAGNVENGEVTSVKTGQTIETAGRDMRIDPATGALELVSGLSQWCRCRDDAGNWYGNDNTRPLYQFVFEERFIRRNPFVSSPAPRVYLTDPIYSPLVYPTSRTVDRFNDLNTMGRFTSACGPAVVRNRPTESGPTEVLICEPVHNLISRLLIGRENIPFSGTRSAAEKTSEFLTSTDNWFRPVRVVSAPNADEFWVCDMYRQVIEHPEWIPEAWQQRMDVYAGSDHGRIYAMSKKNSNVSPVIPNLDSLSDADLTLYLMRTNGWQRDTAQRLLIERMQADSANLPAVIKSLQQILVAPDIQSRFRIQTMWTLALLAPDKLNVEKLLGDEDADLIVNVLQAKGIGSIIDNESLINRLIQNDNLHVRFEMALALGNVSAEKRAALATLAVENLDDVWIRAAILSSSVGAAESVLTAVFQRCPESPARAQLVDGLIATLLGDRPQEGLYRVWDSLNINPGELVDWQIQALHSSLVVLNRKGLGLDEIIGNEKRTTQEIVGQLHAVMDQCARIIADEKTQTAEKIHAIELIGHATRNHPELTNLLSGFLDPRYGPAIQYAAVDSMAALQSVELLVSSIGDASPALQSKILTLLMTREKGTLALLESLEKSEFTLNDLTPAVIADLTQYRNETLRTRFLRLTSTAASPSSTELLGQYNDALETTGDVAQGAKLFETNCAACHRLAEIGNSLGPDLAGLQNKDAQYILTAVLDPNLAIESKYRAFKIVTLDGRFYSGMILDESATNVKIALSDGSVVSVLRTDIETLSSSELSFMPIGFEKSINVSQMADLLAFIQANQMLSTVDNH